MDRTDSQVLDNIVSILLSEGKFCDTSWMLHSLGYLSLLYSVWRIELPEYKIVFSVYLFFFFGTYYDTVFKSLFSDVFHALTRLKFALDVKKTVRGDKTVCLQ